MGAIITEKSQWGNKFIDNLAADIRREFPQTTGFSVRNLKYMKKFSGLFTEDDIDQMGLAYIGEQYPLKVQDEEFFIDLLFYNYLMHCFFAVELKTGKFVPEYAGKMNFYLSVLDDQLKRRLTIPL